MNIKSSLAIGVTLLALSMGTATAGPNRGGPNNHHPRPPKPGNAPEISAASGASAIALITGILLLRSEKSKAKPPQAVHG